MNGKGVVPFPLSCLKLENSKIAHNLPILKWVWASAQSKLRLAASRARCLPQKEVWDQKGTSDLLHKGKCIKNRRDSREVSRESRENLLHPAYEDECV